VSPDARRLLPIQGAYALRSTYALHTPNDPCHSKSETAFAKATNTPLGPASWQVQVQPDGLLFQAWGPGASWCEERAEDLSGLWDTGHDWVPNHPLIAELARRKPGIRLPKMHRVFEALLPHVLGQLVQGVEKDRAWRFMVASLGAEAPGPLGLKLPPEPKKLYRCSQAQLKSWGVLGFQVRTIKELCFVASRLEKAASMTPEAAVALLSKVRGIGPWTIGMAGMHSLGHPDAVPEGDYNLHNMVGHVLLGDATALDGPGAMALLAQFSPNRGRALVLMKSAGPKPKRRHARAPMRDLKA
jgi:3-methyladenine DNA glycosylase/8-oxoguanine DNA glycosylase